MSSPMRYICPKCGGENITHDAMARFDIETQDYVIVQVLDCETCEDCEQEVRAIYCAIE